ncbi:MAG: hypothetical protein CMH57_05050 [Myxococcales bacterium]|nr:hypothetical protein [Myxococcales bacterium]
MNINHIVVGFDFSDTAKEALQIALKMANSFDAEVHVVTSLPGHLDAKVLKDAKEFASPRADQLYAKEALLESMESRVRDALNGLENSERLTSVDVMQIRASKAIAEVADMREADLIVVGATGLGAFQRLLLGSTSQRLVHESRWPVFVVKPGFAWPPQRVMCSVDFSDASRNAVELGADIAAQADAGITVMNVVETTPARMLDAFGVRYVDDFAQRREELRELARRDIEAFINKDDRFEKLAWTPLVTDGLIEECIIETASAKADLLCIGSVGRSGFQGMLLGNTAERVLRELPCSMLITKPDDFVLDHA